MVLANGMEVADDLRCELRTDYTGRMGPTCRRWYVPGEALPVLMECSGAIGMTEPPKYAWFDANGDVGAGGAVPWVNGRVENLLHAMISDDKYRGRVVSTLRRRVPEVYGRRVDR